MNIGGLQGSYGGEENSQVPGDEMNAHQQEAAPMNFQRSTIPESPEEETNEDNEDDGDDNDETHEIVAKSEIPHPEDEEEDEHVRVHKDQIPRPEDQE